MLRIDLATAGIEYRDATGRVFDFHALRCQTATLAEASGVSPRVVQRMMRHSSLELTGRYTRPRFIDIEHAADSLPSLRPEVEQAPAEAIAATNTAEQGISNLLAHHLPTGARGTTRNHAETYGSGEMGNRAKKSAKVLQDMEVKAG